MESINTDSFEHHGFNITIPDQMSRELETQRLLREDDIVSIQTASSKIKIQRSESQYSVVKDKSQEEIISVKDKFNKVRTVISGEYINEEEIKWSRLDRNKMSDNLLGKKLQKLAWKLNIPGEEERLRRKIERYLEKSPTTLSDEDEKNLEFRRQLPNYIIKKLKKMHLKLPNRNINVYRLEMPKYYSRCKMENLKKALTAWLNMFTTKKKDFFGRTVRKEDILKSVANKLEPLVLDRPKSNSEYKSALKSVITDTLKNLPIVFGRQNKEYYLKNLTDTLVNEILNIDANIPTTYIQPTTAEIKHFVKDEITYVLEKSGTAISTKRMVRLETELIDHLLDLTDIEDVDNGVIDDITNILVNIAKIPMDKTRYFTNIIVNDYKEFFFRQHYFKNKQRAVSPEISSAFQHQTDPIYVDEIKNLECYTQRLIEEIKKWLSEINIPIKDENFKEIVIKNLASDIIDRYRYLQMNFNSKDGEVAELEYLKYQIFKRTHKLIGAHNTKTMKYANELMKRINNITIPLSLNTDSKPSDLAVEMSNRSYTPYVDNLFDEIYNWFHKLPVDVHSLEDTRFNRQLMKNLAIDIEKDIKNKELDNINVEVDEWVTKMFNRRLSSTYIEELKTKIRSVTSHFKETIQTDPKQTNIIKSYEEMINKWINTIALESKSFPSVENGFIRELAVKLSDIKIRLEGAPTDDTYKKVLEEISHWLKRLPFDTQVDLENCKEKYATMLANIIQTCNIEESSDIKPVETEEKTVSDKLETAILDWLKELPLYISGKNEKEHQEVIVKELANKLKMDDGISADNKMIEYVTKLEPNLDKDIIQVTTIQLKQYLQDLNLLRTAPLCNDAEDKLLVENIEDWLSKLPFDITNFDYYNSQKKIFIENIKQLKTLGSNDEDIIKEIISFLKTMPIEMSTRLHDGYYDGEADNLVQSLTVGSICKENPCKSGDIKTTIRDAIKNWTKRLPVKPVYNSKELRQVIEEITVLLTKVLNHPDRKLNEKQDSHIKEEITKFFKKNPLNAALISEQRIAKLVDYLTRNFHDRNFSGINLKNRNNVAVYGISVKNTTDDFSIQSINSDDININLDTYTRQIVYQINNWLCDLNLLQDQEDGFKEVMMNDLAGDIVDRLKYLELNPESRGSPEEEVEYLKYQIFKWVNKLVGDHNTVTISHADDLMRIVQSVPVPMLTRPRTMLPGCSKSTRGRSPGRKRVTREDVKKLPTYGPTTDGGSFRQESPRTSSKRISSPGALALPKSPKSQTRKRDPKEEIYEKYEKIFKDKVNELPIDTPTPQSTQLAQLARTGLYNGIIKTFFRLKSDREFENDYGYFELILEDKLDDMLDLLPQTEEMKRLRHSWKLSVLTNAMDMLKEMQMSSDRPSFKQRLKDGFNRKFAQNLELEQCFLLQQGFLSEMADAYILETKYKEENPIKANIYKQRLMKKIDELANHLTTKHNTEFRFLKKQLLAQQAMRVLEGVPIPGDDILSDEVEEILLADEIEQWYKELPITPYLNNFDQVFRKRMIDLLAKKLYEIEKKEDALDVSKERLMKHEMSKFLAERGRLERDQDLNINFMVDELSNRIKSRRLRDATTYDIFENNRPICSTFAKLDKTQVLSPLIDASKQTTEVPMISQPHLAPGSESIEEQRPLLETGQIGPNQTYLSQPGPQYQSADQGALPRVYPAPNLNTSQGVPYQWPGQGHAMQSVGQQLSPPMSPRATQTNLSIKNLERPSSPASSSPRSNLDSSQRQGYISLQGGMRRNKSPPYSPPRSPSRSPHRTSPQRTTLGANQLNQGYATPGPYGQVGLRQEYPNQRVKSPRSVSPGKTNLDTRENIGTQGVTRPRLNRKDTININLQEMAQSHDPDARHEPGKIRNIGKRKGPAKEESSSPHAEGPPCAEENIELDMDSIAYKCRCMERFRRRYCLSSFPCPLFRPPCMYF